MKEKERIKLQQQVATSKQFTLEEILRIVRKFGCNVEPGSKHWKVSHPSNPDKITIPFRSRHAGNVSPDLQHNIFVFLGLKTGTKRE